MSDEDRRLIHISLASGEQCTPDNADCLLALQLRHRVWWTDLMDLSDLIRGCSLDRQEADEARFWVKNSSGRNSVRVWIE